MPGFRGKAEAARDRGAFFNMAPNATAAFDHALDVLATTPHSKYKWGVTSKPDTRWLHYLEDGHGWTRMTHIFASENPEETELLETCLIVRCAPKASLTALERSWSGCQNSLKGIRKGTRHGVPPHFLYVVTNG